jgi:hypothetical protein
MRNMGKLKNQSLLKATSDKQVMSRKGKEWLIAIQLVREN